MRQHEMVLLAMARAAGWSTKRLPYEDLVLQAWREFPSEFSLRNHPEHPDASDIHKRLYQSLKPAGLVISLGNKVFRLTEDGVATARELEASTAGANTAPPQRRLSRSDRSYLQHAISSSAFRTWLAGAASDLIDYDARLFFQFSTGTPVAERRLKVAAADRAIMRAEELGVSEAGSLAALSQHLQVQFSSLLTET